MSALLRKFVARAPRYSLQANDSTWMFFARPREKDSKHQTRIMNLSETGLAFVVDSLTAPKVGDLIKVEFPVPGFDQVAWWAKVVRLEEFQDLLPWFDDVGLSSGGKVLVGIRFEQLPDGHREEIRQGLYQRYLEEMSKMRAEAWLRRKQFLKRYYRQILLFSFCVAAGLVSLYALTQIEHLFDVQQGSIYRQLWDGLDF